MRPSPLVVVCILLALSASPSVAQIGSWSPPPIPGPKAIGRDLTLSGGLALPVGAFGSTRGPDGGCAEPGGGFGLEFTSRYSNGVEGGAALWLDVNPSDSDGMSRILNNEIQRIFPFANELRIDAAQWYSGWLMAKVGYSHSLGDDHRAFVDGYGGIMVLRTPNLTLANVDTGYSSGPSDGKYFVGPAWGVGTGLHLHERISLGITYRTGYIDQRSATSSMRLSLGYAFHI